MVVKILTMMPLSSKFLIEECARGDADTSLSDELLPEIEHEIEVSGLAGFTYKTTGIAGTCTHRTLQ